MCRICGAIALASIAAFLSPGLSVDAFQEHALRGTVVDVTGGVIVGATVLLENAPDGPRAVTTTSRGEFTFPSLRPGAYRIRVTSPGFAQYEQRVEVPGANKPLIVTLQVQITDHVDVSVVTTALSSAGALSSTTLSGAALAALPDDPHNLLRRLQELAGAGGDPSQLVVTVDGFRQSVRLPPKEAIQMIRISANPFAPEFAELARARIDVVTKPGAADWHAELRATFNDSQMNARNALAPRRADEKMRHVSGYLTGPLIYNRWSGVLYAGQWLTDQSHVVAASGIDPATGGMVSLSDTVLTPSKVTSVWFGNDLRLSPGHILNVSTGVTLDDADNRGLESGLDMPQRGYSEEGQLAEVRVSMTSVLRKRMLNEVRGLVSRRKTTSQAVDWSPAVLVLNAFNGGGNQDFLFKENRADAIQIIERLTTTLGRHSLKFGADADTTGHHRLDMTNFNGTFLFGADVERDGSGAPLRNGAGQPIAISPLDNYGRTLAGLPGYGPSQFSISRGDPSVFVRDWWAGWFAQDDWTLHPRLTVSYGVRQEWQTQVTGPDFAGRFGLAWAVDDARRHLVRAGAGRFYGRMESDLMVDVERLGGDRLRQVLIEHPGFFPTVPDNPGDGRSMLPTSYVRAPELQAPETQRVAVAYERQLPKNGFVTIGYDLQAGRYLLRTRNINAPGAGGARPDPARGPVLQYESTGRMRRHEASVGFKFQPTRWISGLANYSYVHGRSDTDGRTTVPADSYDLDAEFGYSAVDRPHHASLGAWMATSFGLSVNPFVVFSSGRPFNITTGYDNNGDGLFADRPALAARGDAAAITTPYGLFDLSPQPGDALVARNAGRDPWQLRVDVNVTQAVRFYDMSLHVSLDVENVFNRANYAGLNGVVTSPTFLAPNMALSPRRALLSCGFSF